MSPRPTGPSIEAAGTTGSSLFRAEAARHQLERLQGSVVVAAPLSWGWIAGILAAVALAITGMSPVHYPSIKTARGMILLDEMTSPRLRRSPEPWLKSSWRKGSESGPAISLW